MKVIKRGIELAHLTNQKRVFISFDDIVDEENYQIHKLAQDFAAELYLKGTVQSKFFISRPRQSTS